MNGVHHATGVLGGRDGQLLGRIIYGKTFVFVRGQKGGKTINYIYKSVSKFTINKNILNAFVLRRVAARNSFTQIGCFRPGNFVSDAASASILTKFGKPKLF